LLRSYQKFEDVNRVNRSHNLKKDRQYNGQKKKDKRTNNDLQNITQKSKDRATQNTTKTRITLSKWYPCKINSYYDLINRYEVSVSQKTTDIIRLSYSQSVLRKG
jgi:hypothetical protein